jgi:hypothetical protein
VSRPERDFDLTQHVVTDLTPRTPETRSAGDRHNMRT